MSYEYYLDDQLCDIIDSYRDDRAMYWEARLKAEEWSVLKQLLDDADEIAVSIRKRAMSLQNTDDISTVNDIYRVYQVEREAAIQSARELCDKIEAIMHEKNMKEHEIPILQTARMWLEQAGTEKFDPQDAEEETDRPLHLVWERLCIDDAWEVTGSMRERVRRIFWLDRLIDDVLGHKQAPKLCIEFLALVSRCYVYGFVPECVVMCRSAMEQAFRAKVSHEHCDRIRRSKERDDSLAVMILAAFAPENNLLASRSDRSILYKAAEEVKERGNKVLHFDSGVTKDALGTIKRTLLVIDALSRLPTPA